jgi:hypothetical protein
MCGIAGWVSYDGDLKSPFHFAARVSIACSVAHVTLFR